MAADDFPDIRTGNGVDRDLAATANDRLMKMTVELRELIRAVNTLEKTTVRNDEKNERLQQKVFYLSVIATLLAATQLADIILRWRG